MHLLRTGRLLCGAALACLIVAPPARANIGPRWWGDVTTEPWGLKEVAITHEELTIDLRPLATGQPVRVEVTYHLNNTGELKKPDLLFISGEVGIRDFEASLNGKPLEVRSLTPKESRLHWERFPPSWQPPTDLPGFDRDRNYAPFHEWTSQAVPVAFSPDLPVGPSTLSVRYRARASGTDEHSDHPTVTWQFPYVLAPAREWGSFGRLDMTAHVPDDWEFRSTPALERDGATLRGNFTGLPADALVLTTRAPVPPELRWATWGCVVLYGLALVGGGYFCWWGGRRLGLTPLRSRWGGLRDVLGVMGLSLSWGALLFWAGFVPRAITEMALHGQVSPYFHERFDGLFCYDILALPVFLILGLVIARTSAARARRSGGVRMPRPIGPPPADDATPAG